jgi:hypothetical protein
MRMMLNVVFARERILESQDLILSGTPVSDSVYLVAAAAIWHGKGSSAWAKTLGPSCCILMVI